MCRTSFSASGLLEGAVHPQSQWFQSLLEERRCIRWCQASLMCCMSIQAEVHGARQNMSLGHASDITL